MLYGVHVWMCLLLAVSASRPGDMSSFFLKAPKSVPRAGRAAPGDYEGFFLKTSKSVPRIGRRNGVVSQGPLEDRIDYQKFLSSIRDNNIHETVDDYDKEIPEQYLPWNSDYPGDYYKKSLEGVKNVYNNRPDESPFYYDLLDFYNDHGQSGYSKDNHNIKQDSDFYNNSK